MALKKVLPKHLVELHDTSVPTGKGSPYKKSFSGAFKNLSSYDEGTSTNLSVTMSPTTASIGSDTGDDITIPLSTGVNAGLFPPVLAITADTTPDRRVDLVPGWDVDAAAYKKYTMLSFGADTQIVSDAQLTAVNGAHVSGSPLTADVLAVGAAEDPIWADTVVYYSPSGAADDNPTFAYFIDKLGNITRITFPNPVAEVSINAQVGETYTLALSDAQNVVTISNANPTTISIPDTASVAFPVGSVITIVQAGSGATTVAAAGTATINSLSSYVKLAGQYAVATLVKTANTGEGVWLLAGDLIVT